MKSSPLLRRCWSAVFASCVVLALAVPGLVHAQTAASPPAPPAAGSAPAASPLTQQQFDQLVDTLSKAVADRLATEGARPATAPAPATAPPAAAGTAEKGKADKAAKPAEPAKSTEPPKVAAPSSDMMMDMGAEEPASEMLLDAIDKSDDVLAEFPQLIEQGGRIPGILRAEINAGRSPTVFLLLVAGSIAALLVAERLLRRILRPARRHLAARVNGTSSFWALAALIGLDIVVLFGLWLVTHGFIVTLFSGTLPQSHLGFLMLTSVFYWRLYLVVFRIALRPNLPEARLPEISDAEALTIYRWSSAIILVAIILSDIRRVLEGMHSPPLVVACAVLINTAVLTALLVGGAVAMREPVAHWLQGLTGVGTGGRRPLTATVARFWLVIAIPAFLALGMARAYGVLTSVSGVHEAILTTMNVIIGLLILESFMDKVCKLMRADTEPKAARRERAIEALMRCLRVAILLGALTLLFRTWAVHGVSVMEMDRYTALANAALPAAGILLGAYCAWQAVEYFTRHHIGAASIAMPGAQDGDGPPVTVTSSRLSTLMPLLRVTLSLAIVVMAALTVLSQLGIDITPLIAGASIVGLAISFGSQTLVKDIVSGVFFLVDDAFRVGEYIDCGKAKGTVEGFTLRSLKLRHQNGMIHTVPFGQLGQVTNFSRDWSTLKFNLRFTRNTDLEKLRKTVKKIGLELLEDPEYKDDFLMPLKMQGVADITDNALIVRFKFTVKPTRPTVIQREAVKRMIRILPEQGIEFANNIMAVQSLGGPADPTAAGGAAAGARIAADMAERAAAAEAAAT